MLDEDSYGDGILINPFYATVLFLYHAKTGNQEFSDVVRGIERGQWHEMG